MKRRIYGFTFPVDLERRVKYPVQELPVNQEECLKDCITIGKVLNSIPQSTARLARRDLFRHVLIAGSTGSGKSYTASRIATRVSKYLGIPVVILDWHGEYSTLLGESNIIDPYTIPIPLFTRDPNDLAVISSVLDLTPPQEYLLDKVSRKIESLRIKSIESLLDYIEGYPEESNWLRESKLSLHRKLSILAREKYSQLFTLRAENTYETMFPEVSIPIVVDLARIRDTSIRRLYASFYIKRIVEYAIQRDRELVVVVEEAYNYLARSNPVKPICEMLREVRKFNVGLVIVSQFISQLAEDVLVNTNTKIIHAVKSRQDLEAVENTLYLERNLLEILPYLEPGEAVYSTPGLKKTVLVKIE